MIQKSPQVFWVTAASVMTIIGPDWDTLTFQEKTLRMLKGSLLGHVAPFSGAVMTAIQPLMMRNIPDLLFFGSGNFYKQIKFMKFNTTLSGNNPLYTFMLRGPNDISTLEVLTLM